MKLKKGWKIFFGVAVGVVILLALASVAVKIVFTKQRLVSLLIPRIEGALQRKVEIEDVSLSIWGGLGVDVKGMRIFNPEGFEQESLFRFDQLSIRVKFLPLFQKRIEIKKLIIDAPQINLERNKKGITNFGDLIRGEGGSIILPVAFDRLQIRGGEIRYTDDVTKKKIVLHQYEQDERLLLDQKMENAEITGRIRVNQIELNLPDYKGKLPPLSISLEHHINLNIPKDLLDIKSVKIGIGEVGLDMKGKVEKLSSSPFLDLKIESDKIPLRDLFNSLPQIESSPLNQLKTSGNIEVLASVKGELKGTLFPRVEGRVVLKDAKVEFPDVSQPLTMPYGEINFNNRSLNFFSSEAKLGGAPMEVKLVLEDFSDPSLSSKLRINLDLVLLSEFVSLPEGTHISGQAEMNLRAYGKVKLPETMNFSGRVDLRKAQVKMPSLGVPVRNLDAEILLKGEDVDVSNLTMTLGKSPLSLQGKVYRAIPYFLSSKKGKPLLSFNLDSPYLNLDEIFPVPSAEGKAEKGSGGAGVVLLPDINVEGQLFIKKAIFREMEFSNLSASMNLTDGVLRMDNLVAQVFSGSVGGRVSCDLKDIDHIQYDMNFTANQIEANDFLSRFTSLDDHLFGKLNLNASFSGRGNRLEDIQKTLFGSGTVSFADGRLVNFKILEKLASFLKIKSFKEQKIKTLRNSFRVVDGRIWFDDFSATTRDGDFELLGSVGLDGSLDYKLTVVLSEELSLGFDALGDLSGYLKNEQGRVVLDIKISGSASSPNFVLETSRAEKKFKEQMKARVKEKKEEIKDQFKKKAEEWLKNLFEKKKK